MQFKHPEILYILFALLIPVFIHLFQLQRFTKTTFTNVKFLRQVELQTRKSAQLKKWLVLFARLMAFTALIVAFAQPYFSEIDTSKQWLTTFYLDNSISMKARGERGELMKRAVQDIIENIPDKGNFTLLTNNTTAVNLTKEAIIEKLKNISYSPLKTDLNTILLKANQYRDKQKGSEHKLLLFSDFQQQKSAPKLFETTFDFVKLEALKKQNISIESVQLLEVDYNSRTIEVAVKNQGKGITNLSLRAFNNQIVLAKTLADIPANTTKSLRLQLPKEYLNISLKIASEDRFEFDNTHFISFTKPNKIKVLLISDEVSFLEKIYTSDEFELTLNKAVSLTFEEIDEQALVVLDNLKSISPNLQTALNKFVLKGGSLVIIPNKNIDIISVNQFFNKLNIGQLKDKQVDSLKITNIHFSHPILKDVFEKRIKNFQYPSVNTYFITNLLRESTILSFENKQPFISQINRKKGFVYWVASPLDKVSSNFINAPLVVPVFYNIAKQSVLPSKLSYRLGRENKISIAKKIKEGEVLHITNNQSDFIPLQQIKSKKVILTTSDEVPSQSGFYKITNKEKIVGHLAFNFSKDESSLSFRNMSDLALKNKNINAFDTVEKALSTLALQQNIQSYFKWFILLSLLFLIIEILLLKYL